MSEFDFAAGEVLLIDKPLEWTSFDVVAKVRNTIRIKKVGHAGTLDPLATGLLILCTGKFTKRIEEYMAAEKEYEGTILLGASTPSYDAATAPDAIFPIEGLTEEAIRAALVNFIGTIQQVPPAFSAIKIKGERAYSLARKGKEVQMEPREVEVKEFEITRFALPELDFRIVCGKGTYIRSLAHDLGRALNNGAHLTRLVRTRIGDHHLKNAWQLDDFIQEVKGQVTES